MWKFKSIALIVEFRAGDGFVGKKLQPF